MLLRTVELVLKDGTYEVISRWKKGAMFDEDELCRLESIFEFPISPIRVWFVVHDCPGVNRQEFQIKLDVLGDEYPAIFCGDKFFLDDPELDRVLKPLVGKSVYLQVEYEE